MPNQNVAKGIEFGSGVFGITVTVGAVQKTVAYLTVIPALDANTPGEEIWYVVDDPNGSAAHRAWADHAPSSAHDPKVLHFNWLQADIDDFVANQLPTGAGAPTYLKHVHTAAFAVATGLSAREAADRLLSHYVEQLPDARAGAGFLRGGAA